MSSIQIFNIKNNIEKRDLEYLSVFAQYKTVAQRILKKSFQFEVKKKKKNINFKLYLFELKHSKLKNKNF